MSLDEEARQLPVLQGMDLGALVATIKQRVFDPAHQQRKRDFWTGKQDL